jgi:O-antigen ligase
LAIFGSIAVIVVGFAWVRPVEFGYLIARFGDFFVAEGASDIGNWRVREMHWSAVERVVSRIDPWFGLGFPEAGSNPVDSFIYLWTWDNTWLPILYRFGIAGILVLGLLVLCFAVRALRMALSAREESSYFGLVFLITIAMTAIMTLWGPTFMDPVITLGFWSFAFVAVEALRPVEVPVSAPREGSPAGPAMPSVQQ